MKIDCGIGRDQVLSHLSPYQFSMLLSPSYAKKYAQNQLLILQNQPINTLYYVVDGFLLMSRSTPDSNLNNFVFGQSLLGTEAFWGVPAYLNTALVKCASLRCYEWPISLVQSIMQDNPPFALALMQQLRLQINQLERRYVDFTTASARKRVLKVLSALKNQLGRDCGDQFVIEHNCSLAEIASLSDTSSQTVSALLAELEQKNVISYSRHEFSLLNPEANDFLR